MRVLLTAYNLTVYYLSYGIFVVFALALNLFCLAFFWLPASPRTERFFQGLIRAHLAAWLLWLRVAGVVRVRFDGFAGLPRDRGLVLVANHPGLMDIGYLLARVPGAICVFKPAIRRNPVLGAAVRRAGYFGSDGGHDLLREAASKVAAGRTLILFPEGTRSCEGELNPFKPGFVLVAHLARAPIQLVRIHCNVPLLVKERPWWKPLPLPMRVVVTLGPCLPPPAQESPRVITAGVEAWFRSGSLPVTP